MINAYFSRPIDLGQKPVQLALTTAGLIAATVFCVHQFIPGGTVVAVLKHAITVAFPYATGFVLVAVTWRALARHRLVPHPLTVGRVWGLSFIGFLVGFTVLGVLSNPQQNAHLHGQAVGVFWFFKILSLWAGLTYLFIRFRLQGATHNPRSQVIDRNRPALPENPEPCIELKVDGLPRAIPVHQVSHVRVEDHCCSLFYYDNHSLLKIVVSRSLHQLLGELGGDALIQIHRSHAVNLHFVQRATKKGRQVFLTVSDTQLPVSRNRIADVTRLLKIGVAP